MKGLKSSAQAKYDLRYHFVFVPKYRKRVLKGTIASRIAGMIRFCAQIHGWEVFELAVREDHVHLYIGVQPKYSPSEVMKYVKGGTSNKIREMFPELDEIYWGSTFWADGYLVKSVGEIDDKVVSEYIKKQR
ncbi:IS200/IS605 family transposase [Candidatus Daviesbacteria bacterium]|nr:IS200/IS605 family transposase [Candidatus Daviesbacteria bacterium]